MRTNVNHWARSLGLALGCASISACNAIAAASTDATARYELACNASNTRTTAALFCVRLDSSTGDVRRVDLQKARTTDGPTQGSEKGAGAYQIVCDSTSTDARADFHCVRLDRESGEVVVIGLPHVESIAN